MSAVLIVYSTTDGHTQKICERLSRVIEMYGHAVRTVPIEETGGIVLTDFQKIVVGASIRYGKHSQKVIDYVNTHAMVLDTKPNAFFSVNIVARKPDKNRPQTNPYLQKFLQQIAWHPRQLEVFAGKLDYPRYRFFDRLMIRFIMLVTGGPTDPRTVVEFTDWGRVDSFARLVATM